MNTLDLVLILATQGLALATGVVAYLSVRRRVGEVHTLVNSRSDRQDQRIEQLTGTLHRADVDVPDLYPAAGERVSSSGASATPPGPPAPPGPSAG